jgi:hypothetical protein
MRKDLVVKFIADNFSQYKPMKETKMNNMHEIAFVTSDLSMLYIRYNTIRKDYSFYEDEKEIGKVMIKGITSLKNELKLALN